MAGTLRGCSLWWIRLERPSQTEAHFWHQVEITLAWIIFKWNSFWGWKRAILDFIWLLNSKKVLYQESGYCPSIIKIFYLEKWHCYSYETDVGLDKGKCLHGSQTHAHGITENNYSSCRECCLFGCADSVWVICCSLTRYPKTLWLKIRTGKLFWKVGPFKLSVALAQPRCC